MSFSVRAPAAVIVRTARASDDRCSFRDTQMFRGKRNEQAWSLRASEGGDAAAADVSVRTALRDIRAAS